MSDNLEKILKKMGFTEGQWDVYKSEVAKIESQGSGGYAARGGSGFHYDGKYQLGRDAKNDAIRLLKKLEIPVPKSLKTHESFYDDTEGSSRSDFRNSSEAQELAFAAFTLANHMSLSGSENYKGKAPKEKLEILGIAHNQGAGKTEKWLSDPETNLRDAFGTNAEKYSNAIKNAFAAVNPTDYAGVEPDFTLDYDAQLEEVENTKQVQKNLNELGYEAGKVDGFWGEKTRDAIKRYQKAEGLEATGKLNPELISSVGIMSVAEADAPIPKPKPDEGIMSVAEAAAPIPVSKPDEGIMSVAEADSVPSVELLNAVMRDRIPVQEVASWAEGGFVQTGPKLTGEPTAQALASGLATLGRYGDGYMVHAAEGETVIPAEVFDANPGLKNDIFRQMQVMGIENPDRYVVGSGFNSINPVTGQPEFFFKKIFKALKKIIPIAAPIVGNLVAPGIGGIVGSALGTAVSGGSTKDIFKNILITGGTQALMGGLGNLGSKTGGGFFGGAQRAMGSILRPGDALEKGIFGTRYGGNLGSIYRATMGSKPISGVSVKGPTTIGKTLYGESRPMTQGYRDISGDIVVGSQEPVSAHSSVDKGNWFSNLGPLGRTTVLGGGALGLAGLAGAFDEDEDEDEDEVGAPDRAYQDYLTKMHPTIADQRAAGIRQAVSGRDLMRILGLTEEQADAYLKSMYDPTSRFVASGGEISGPGSGTSDSIPAYLSDGEFVMTAEAVRGAGNGDRKRGAARMYDLMNSFERIA